MTGALGLGRTCVELDGRTTERIYMNLQRRHVREIARPSHTTCNLPGTGRVEARADFGSGGKCKARHVGPGLSAAQSEKARPEDGSPAAA